MKRSGSIGRALDCESRDCMFETHRRHYVASLRRHFIRCLVLVQPSKKRNGCDMTEILLTGTYRHPGNIVNIYPFLFGRSFLRMLFINAKALFMRFYVLSMHFVSICLNIVLSHAFSE